MGRLRHTAGEKELIRLQMCRGNPRRNRLPGLLGDLKLHRPLGLLLHDNRARTDPTALYDIVNVESDQIASSQLAVDGQVE